MNQNFSSFIFDRYQLDQKNGRVLLNYRFDSSIHFTETLHFDLNGINWPQVDRTALDNALACLHLAGGVSYYKAYCPKTLVLNSQSLNEEQVVFWNNFYTKGLGEFFFRNGIDPDGLINFPARSQTTAGTVAISPPDRSLVPIGGGKDSIVSAETIARAKLEFSPFCMNFPAPVKATVNLLRKDPIIVKRELAPELFEINSKGALNGHIPITGYLSCLAVVSAILYGYRHIVMSLEKSADFAQAYSGQHAINHQYSKSFEFEKSFVDYLNSYICTGIDYFSLLRPYYELRIAKLFAEITADKPLYLEVFASCNSNFKQNSSQQTSNWCGNCPKCAFVFAILAPFVPAEQLCRVFGKNLLDNRELIDLYRSLLGLTEQLPFECVGTSDEMRAALWLIKDHPKFKDTPVMKIFRQEIQGTLAEPEKLIDDLLAPSPYKNLPQAFRNLFNE